MTLLAGVFRGLLVIAAVYVLALLLTHWLERRGGFTIRVEVRDDNDD